MQTEELELAPADAPDIATLKRIDAPEIWKDFASQLAPLETESLAIVVTDASQLEIANLADQKRKAVKALRCAVENKRKELVAGMNKTLREINAEAGEIWDRCEAIEKHLEEQVQFAAKVEAERVAKLQAERSARLLAVGGNPSYYPALGEMPEEGFAQLVEGLEVADRLRKEREAKAEADRIAAEKAAEEARAAKEKADAEERERQRIENERLKAEAEQARQERLKEQALREVERQRLEAEKLEIQRKADQERKAAEAKARAEREEIERAAEAERKAAAAAAEQERQRIAAERAKLAKEQAAKDAKAKAEREALAAKLKAEQDAREKAEAEQRAKEEAEEAARAAAAKAPDREKLMALAGVIRSIEFPKLSTSEGQETLATIISKAGDFAAWIEKKAGAM